VKKKVYIKDTRATPPNHLRAALDSRKQVGYTVDLVTSFHRV